MFSITPLTALSELRGKMLGFGFMVSAKEINLNQLV
jgi:hypothetical protein